MAGEMADRSFLNDPKYWRDRAEEARTRADQLDDPQSKSPMMTSRPTCGPPR